MRALIGLGVTLVLTTSSSCVFAQTSVETIPVLETPYFPLAQGHQWVYRAGEQKVVVRAEDTEFKEIRKEDKKNNTVIIEKVPCFRLDVVGGNAQDVVEKREGAKALRLLSEHVAVLQDGIYRFSGAGKDISPPLRFFKLPLKEGETWECDCSSDGVPLKGTFTSNRARVTVPAGSYDTMTARGSIDVGPKKMDVQYWFAPDVGMVKQFVKIGDYEVTLELERFEPARAK